MVIFHCYANLPEGNQSVSSLTRQLAMLIALLFPGEITSLEPADIHVQADIGANCNTFQIRNQILTKHGEAIPPSPTPQKCFWLGLKLHSSKFADQRSTFLIW